MAYTKIVKGDGNRTLFHHLLREDFRRGFPVIISIVSQAEVSQGTSCSYHLSPYFTAELVLEGEFLYKDALRGFTVHPGELFLLTPDKDQMWQCTAGPARKEYVSISGYMLSSLLQQLKMRDIGPVRLPAPDDWLSRLGNVRAMIDHPQRENLRKLSGMALEMLLEISELCSSQQYPRALRLALDYLSLHLEEKFDLRRLCRHCGICATSMIQLFNQYLKITPGQYSLEKRLEIAATRLRDATFSVKEIANQLHYPSSQYFATEFKRRYGVTPSEFRKK